ncbi:hypothetical protein HMPREF9447_03663 [Bacteroides oleiciplenus YIT 12058]|uniref:Uncharacterized protein n=1 Tax=Bacteroides oleiciplenus YIT 12058 TaxID=742727 RepID=K9DY76_9BACE|nr:hypothetical protein HMPREF9447_03663 [Bacteroides oleiciplenus YIT 12058]
MGVVYRFYNNPFYHVTKIAMGFTVWGRNSRNDYRDFPKCFIFKEDKLHLSITFSCKHESSAFDLHYLCN